MMPIVLTGDVHHTIRSSDQCFTSRSEASLAVDYARVAARHNLKVTLFFTGRAIVEDGSEAEELLAMENVEIGGHGWDALRPRWWHRMMNLFIGSPHGPPWLQRRMVQRTCKTLEQYAAQPVRSWRNHAYRHDGHTPRLLHEAGVITWSDHIELGQSDPLPHQTGILILPINTLPDHENLYHGARTCESVAKEGRDASYPPELWCDMVCAQVETIVHNGGIATLLAHPICMKVADDFATLDQLCGFLARYPSLLAHEVAEWIS